MAHVPTVTGCPKAGEIELVSMIGLLCPRCGFNWGRHLNYGMDWRAAGYDINDLCDSKAEKDYYHYLPSGLQDVAVPQLYVEVDDMKGFFIDWYFPHIGVAVEIDGMQHLKQTDYDARRDRALTDKGYIVQRIPTTQLAAMIRQKRAESWQRFASKISPY